MKRNTWIAALVLATAGTATVLTTFPATAFGQRGGDRGDRIEQMFEKLDTDGNGEITQAEMDAAATERFSTADANGDGLLSAEEIVAAAQNRRAERMIERLDGNGDGLLSQEEMAAGRQGRLFERLDANDDGVITKAEAEEAKGRFGGRRHGRGGDDTEQN